jgi:pyruvate dehydrogenase E2 component (dihydrolipoamide acetyltransferase)
MMYEVKFADIGEGIHEGVIYKFPINEGDTIEDGDTLFLVETDKVTAEIPSPVEGVVHKIHFQEGDTIHVGETIVTIETDESHEIVEEKGSTSVVGDLEISSEVIPSSVETVVEESKKKKVLATPVARKLAKDHGIDIKDVVGTGPQGRVMKADILAYKKVEPDQVEKVKVVQSSGQRREQLSTVRKAIADHMVKSKFTIPHTAVMDECIVDDLVAYRKDAKLIARTKNIKLTYLPFIIKAVVTALKEYEILNASYDGEVIYHDSIHIGIAVDTPYGLVVPVIKDAQNKSIFELAEAIDDLSDKARDKRLTLEEISGSTFTITNYGAFGSSFGVPVINHPNSAILGIGKIDKKAIVKDDALAIGYVLPLSMSFDHRIIDGGDAGRFMMALKALLTDPRLLLMS